MICYVLGRPVGDGTYTPELGFTTAGVDTLIGSVICRPDFLGDVGTFSSTIDVSQAQGNAPQALKHSFALIDSDGDVRRSIGVFDGSLRLVGWQVLVYISETNLGTPQLLDSPASFIVTEAPVNGESINISMESAWGLNLSTCAFGDGDAAVGLVAGGHEVTVQTAELDLPDPIQFDGWSDWFVGNPGASPSAAPTARTAAYYRLNQWPGNYLVQFRTATLDAAYALSARLTQDGAEIILRGSEFSVPAGDVYGGYLHGDTAGRFGVEITVPQWFYDFEDNPEEIELLDIGGNSSAIVAGADSVAGFLDDEGRTVTPLGSYSTPSSYVTAFNPRSGSAAGLLCYTLIPGAIAWEGWEPGVYTAPHPESAIGTTVNIQTGDGAVPAYGSYSSGADMLQPFASDSLTLWAKCRTGNDGASALRMTFRFVPDDPSVTFPRYAAGIVDRIVAQPGNTAGLIDVDPVYRFPFTTADEVRGPTLHWDEVNSGDPYLSGPPDLLIAERNDSPPDAYVPAQTFASLDDLNACLGFEAKTVLSAQLLAANYQMLAARFYGVSSLAYGSAWAVVTPGASPWWASALGPIQTAGALANSVGVEGTFSSPSNVVSAAEWSEFFDPSTTRIDAAVSLCKEFWGILGTGENNVDATGYGEVISPPGLALGSTEDIITLPTIEYAYWKGEYTKKAYVANVDQDFDITRQDEFFGGWDEDNTTGYGLAIWSACRRAWQTHGFLISKSFEAPGVFSASTLGRMWSQAKRNGVARIDWLALQPRFLTLKVRETLPTWWAGNTVKIPTAMAEFAGYDLTEFDGQALVCVSKEWDPMSLSSTFEVILPPVIPQASGDRIIVDHTAADRIIVDHTATDRIIVEA